MPGHRRRGHPLALGELAHADPRRALDRDEQRDLAAGYAERVDLAAELAIELEEHRPQPFATATGSTLLSKTAVIEEIVNQVNSFAVPKTA